MLIPSYMILPTTAGVFQSSLVKIVPPSVMWMALLSVSTLPLAVRSWLNGFPGGSPSKVGYVLVLTKLCPSNSISSGWSAVISVQSTSSREMNFTSVIVAPPTA